jgi:hypothetical protein
MSTDSATTGGPTTDPTRGFAAPSPARHRRLGDLPVLAWPAFDPYPVDALVTTRHGGVSGGAYGSLNLGLHVGDDADAVLANRRRVAVALGAAPADFVFCAQSHRAEVATVTAADRGRGRGRGSVTDADAPAGVDAVVTAEPGVVLAVLVADCVPIVLYDPVAHVLACVHAGWRGTVAGVTTAAVARMRELGSDPADLLAGIGPSIQPSRYQVGEDVRDAAQAAFGDRAGQVLRPDGTGRWTFDLWQANTLQLTDAGVAGSRVLVAGLDTGAGTPFFSHRGHAPCGRFAAVARLRPREAGR